VRPAYVWAGRVGLVAAGALVVALMPRFVSDFRALELALVAIYFVALLGLNVLTGYSGQISIGHGAFMALGGYTTAILVSDQGLALAGHTFSSDLKDLWTIPLAGLVAGIFGFLFGVPALRLSGPYLALATFGAAVALPPVLRKYESFTGGSLGINLFGLEGHTGGVSGVTVLGRHLTFNDYMYYLAWSIAGVLFVAAWLLLRGRTGRALRAVRDSEVAAASSGVSIATYKTFAFAVSAFYAGVAGSLFAIHTTYVNPDVFPISLSIFLVVGLVVGGLGSLAPLVVGAVFIVYVDELARWLAGWEWLPGSAEDPGASAIVSGLVLILVMVLLPTGAGGLVRRALGPLTSRRYTRPSE
jgi:branched-chain amino acid transport system permease protein